MKKKEKKRYFHLHYFDEGSRNCTLEKGIEVECGSDVSEVKGLIIAQFYKKLCLKEGFEKKDEDK